MTTLQLTTLSAVLLAFADTFVIELANGGLGYLPSPEQHELGGYETWLTVNRVEKTASPKIVDRLMEVFATVAQ